MLSRIQFAGTIAFHYLFPPLTIGLSVILVVLEAQYLRSGKPLFEQATRFWAKIFGLIFAIGVATGIVMEFQFGTNWARYSSYVGDIFGSLLAAEGIFAFFLESGFLAILLFGWERVGRRLHFFATVMVTLGAHFSAVWIVVANSWQQTPAGYRIVEHAGGSRAELTGFWQAVLNPSTVDRLTHTLLGCWQAGAFLVLSVSAYYLLKQRHQAFARASIKVALGLGVVASLGQLITGHQSARGVAVTQPAKLAAFEGHYPASAPAALYLVGWVDETSERVAGVGLPGWLSLFVHGDPRAPVTGLRAFAPPDRPPVQAVFQSYHLMVAIGLGLIGLSLVGLVYWWRGRLHHTRWLLRVFVVAVAGPQIANQLGWFSAEVGRQPWIVYGLLRTADASSPTVSARDVMTSMVMFGLVYALLFAAYLYLLHQKIRTGPAENGALALSERAHGQRA